jgi:IclR family acetate operon transcriptional repressor
LILNCLAEHKSGLSLTAIVKDTNLAPSTAHRLLTTLQSERFVQFEPEALHWLVGAQAFTVGIAFSEARMHIASRQRLCPPL